MFDREKIIDFFSTFCTLAAGCCQKATCWHLAQYQFFKLRDGIPLPLHLRGKEYIEREFFACYLLVAGRKGLNKDKVSLYIYKIKITKIFMFIKQR